MEKEWLIKAIDTFERKLIVVSPKFKIMSANFQINGLPGSEIVGKFCHEVFCNSSTPCNNCAIKEAKEKGKPALRTDPENTLDVNIMPCYYAYPIYSGKNIDAFVSMDLDLSTRGAVEEKLQRSDAFLMKEKLEKIKLQLMQAEKMASIGALAAGVAHQLNNPIGGITLFAKLLMEEYDLEEGAKEDLRRIMINAERCRATVKELLEFSRPTLHLMEPNDINQAISRSFFLLENQPIFKNIEIEKDLMLSLPLALTDNQQINHMLMNIIINAAQAMEGKGKLTVKSYLSTDGDRACIEISDTGPGIPEDVLPHIFDPFFTTKEKGKGTGLGLSMVFSIVENHGGIIKARSNPAEGTTFVIELPFDTEVNGEDESKVQT
ncbi:MAG: hypothetical protein H8D96_06635 [Desulfobacterales bacterium]|uniref:histidine kinase n=1 Tax=Candidatus Desulfatibia vada TaxID=2841696 RepID=A0A8J6P283_9BACT|nr:hypothetical protein [Candidatus Desulfatibia vada]MBL6970727.1 hypothetical protein [Desulfobacterales bacterium]